MLCKIHNANEVTELFIETLTTKGNVMMSNELFSKHSFLGVFMRNTRARVLRNRRVIYMGFTRLFISILFLTGFYGCVVGLMFYRDGLPDISVLFLGLASGSMLLALCLICFVPSVRRALFWE